MKTVVALLSLSAALAFAQHPSNQGQNPSGTPPAMVPDTGQQPTPTPLPRQDKAAINSQMRDNIRSSLSGDPILSGTNVEVSVDDVNITLTGTVESEGQMRRVLALVSPYISYRQVVNKVQIR